MAVLLHVGCETNGQTGVAKPEAVIVRFQRDRRQ